MVEGEVGGSGVEVEDWRWWNGFKEGGAEEQEMDERRVEEKDEVMAKEGEEG